MICKRYLRTALRGLAGFGVVVVLLDRPVRADVVTGISNLDQANRLSLFHDYSIDALGLTGGSIPGSVGSGVFTPFVGNMAATEPSDAGHLFDISVTPLAGYDSNPEARRVGQGSAFGGADLTAVYGINIGESDPNLGSPTQFVFAYDATGGVYDGTVSEADTFQQTFSAAYRRSLFHDTVRIGVMADDQFTTEHGSAFLNTVDAVPSVEWLMIPQASVELNYDYTYMLYFAHTVTERSPDADRSTVNVKFHFYPTPQVRGDVPESPDVLGDILRQSLYRATIGYGAVFNQARGLDYQYEANRLSIGFEGLKLPNQDAVSVDALYAHEWDNYMHPSTEGPVVLAGKPKQRRRHDHIDVFTLRTNARLLDLPHDSGTLAAFLQWDLIADRSTIVARHYNEFAISGGLTYGW